MKKTKIIYYVGVAVFLMFYFILFNTTHAQIYKLLNRSVFSESEKSSIVIRPIFFDYSTSLILYVSNGDTPETWTYEPEMLGFGYFLFSDYFSFGSPVGRYILVEYKNDEQTFSCYGLPLNECVANTHFISQQSFEIIDNNTIIPVLDTVPTPFEPINPNPEILPNPAPILETILEPLIIPTPEPVPGVTPEPQPQSEIPTPESAPEITPVPGLPETGPLLQGKSNSLYPVIMVGVFTLVYILFSILNDKKIFKKKI